jgi:hypothetical protein
MNLFFAYQGLIALALAFAAANSAFAFFDSSALGVMFPLRKCPLT